MRTAAPMLRLRRGHVLVRTARAGHHSPAHRPRVTTQPRGTTAIAGRLASFTATASGAPAPAVQWQRSANRGRTWAKITGAHAVTYAFTAKTSENGDEYRAVFRNSLGSATTARAALGVRRASKDVTPTGRTVPPAHAAAPTGPLPSTDTAPVLTIQPASQTVKNGASVTFTAAASGTPAPAVQWEISTNDGGSFSPIPGATATSYTIIASAATNHDAYRAVFTNAAGSATSAAATLSVSAGAHNSAPVLTTQPASKVVESGASATFSAAASGAPAPTVQWEISTDGGSSFSPIPGATTTSYSLTAGDGENGNEYRAVFTNALGTVRSAAATLSVPETDANWSGYAVLGTAFSNVTGSWTVASVSCPAGATAFASQWIGIDGYANDTVEQDGTDADCVFGTAHYSAWYEMYGDNAVNHGWAVPLPASQDPVSPGDQMTASVSVSGSSWTLAIADATRGWSDSVPIAAPAQAPQRASAEWILERPDLGPLDSLADVGTVSFTGASASDATTSGPISAFTFTPLAMVGSTLLAAPGLLSPNGESFSASWQAGS